ncbi:hypothetical protein J5690_07185 [bacterium]|nr:hypothetical protein [bacterium]
MSKLFVFGIGGTGSRVIKSLVMLLMAGVKSGVDEIIPIIIDRDEKNGNMADTQTIVNKYRCTQKAFTYKSGKFFSTKISLLNEKLLIPITDETKKFSEYIKTDKLNGANQALANALFSGKALDMCTTEGFRGVPSIGSFVLNQIEENEVFKMFNSDFFQKDDKIFIVSSIFGGTGASGFPLLLKTLRDSKEDNVSKAPIGAISVLPYFTVGESDEKEKEKVVVDSDTFDDKAVAALHYYDKAVNNLLDRMYYVGDSKKSIYPYCAGGNKQKNPAHFVELVAALSIINFAKSDIKPSDSKNRKTKYYEFGFKSPQQDPSGEKINFEDLADLTKKVIGKPLIQFYAFKKYMDLIYDEQCNTQPWSKKSGYNKEFKKGMENNLIPCFATFNNWLQEMGYYENHKRKFLPFNLEKNDLSFVCGFGDVKKNKQGWAWFDEKLNSMEADVDKNLNPKQKFLELFYDVTERFVDEKIPNSNNF